MFKKIDLKTVIKADQDPILSRKMDQTTLDKLFQELPTDQNFLNLRILFFRTKYSSWIF